MRYIERIEQGLKNRRLTIHWSIHTGASVAATEALEEVSVPVLMTRLPY